MLRSERFEVPADHRPAHDHEEDADVPHVDLREHREGTGGGTPEATAALISVSSPRLDERLGSVDPAHVAEPADEITKQAAQLAKRGAEAVSVAGAAGLGGAAGGVGGAGAGAAIGFAIGGPPGAAVGFLAGFISGALGGTLGAGVAANKVRKILNGEQS